MSKNLRTRVLLGAMMFFQYAAWGAWAPVLGATLGSETGIFKAPGDAIGAIFGILWLACIVVPFIGGQLVDRKVPGQLFMGVAGIVCAASAYIMSSQTQVGDMIGGLIPVSGLGLWLVVWSIAFAPTIGIGNSITLHHLSQEEGSTEAEREKAFSIIRTMGTIGWVVVAFAVMWAKENLKSIPVSEMTISTGAAVLWAIASFLVPHTPPKTDAPDPWAFLKAFKLFKTVPGFTAFIIISLVASAEFQFYYTLSGQFLESLGVPESQIAPYKATSQVAEVLSLAVLLPIAIRKFGMRTTLVVGTIAWALRYFIFATEIVTPVVLSLSLHGVGFAFVFVTSYFYIDRVAPKDIRGSAQSLFTLITLGVGNYLGSILSGKLQVGFTEVTKGPIQLINWTHLFSSDFSVALTDVPTQVKVVNWPMIFIVPAVLTLLSAIGFQLFFKEPKIAEGEEIKLAH